MGGDFCHFFIINSNPILTPEIDSSQTREPDSPDRKEILIFSYLMQILVDTPQCFSITLANIKRGLAEYETETETFHPNLIPHEITLRIVDLSELLRFLSIQDWPDPVPYACPLLRSCNSKFSTSDEYQKHFLLNTSSKHTHSELLMTEGSDPLSVMIHEISNYFCQYVRPLETNVLFGHYRCFVTDCNSSRGTFADLMCHFFENTKDTLSC